MTVPQQDQKPTGQTPGQLIEGQESKGPANYDKLQRCWFVTLGLMGSFGFVASQVNFALAEGDFLLDDYATSPGAAALSTNYAVSDTTFTLQEPTFEAVPVNLPAPAAFIEAPPAPEVAAEAFAPAAETAVTSSIEIEVAPAATTTAAASRVAPTVSPVAPPTFTTVKKPLAKAVNRSPLVGLVEASAVATPLSNYMRRPVTNLAADNLADADSKGALLMASSEASAAAVPDILPEAAAPTVEPTVEAAPEAAAPAPIQSTEIVPAALPEGTSLPEEYNSIFVDPTEYSVGATEAPESTQSPSVVVSEQSTGCEFVVGAGQAVPNGACGAASSVAPAPAPLTAGNEPAPVANAPTAPAYQAAPVASAPAVNVGPVSFSVNGIRFSGSTTAAGRAYLNRSVRPLVNLQAAQQFIFPLSIPSPITSLFGYRVHPITGDYRFHAGTDIGAAQGTPVLAVQDGSVETAGTAGGYGLMVVLNHRVEDTQLQSRYAHLSEILVEPGTKVNKGDVIGLVGSTGNSTGPHLHFEMMQATADGWVLVNADSLVQNSLSNLVRALNNPMQALNFNLADLNLKRAGALPAAAQTEAGTETLSPGQNGIPFRPAQPNAS
ncbi:MAG: M23 family metallopeptidase [Phormidesmis sp.]